MRTFCFFILRATPWCWPPPAPYQRRHHLSCDRSGHAGHWAPTSFAGGPRTPYDTASVVPFVECLVRLPSVPHGGRGPPTHPLHDTCWTQLLVVVVSWLTQCYLNSVLWPKKKRFTLKFESNDKSLLTNLTILSEISSESNTQLIESFKILDVLGSKMV